MKRYLLLTIVLTFFCTTLFVFSQETVEEWQAKAVQAYPDLGVAGSATNLKFIQMVNYLKVSNPAFFNDPKWPYTLALQLARPALIPGLADNPQAASTPAISGTNADDTVDAGKFAADYGADQKNADGQYLGKKFTVTGKILRIAASDNPTNVAFVYLDAGKNLPCVKVELNKMKKYEGTVRTHFEFTDKHGYELRVTNDSTLEVRSHDVNSGYGMYYNYNNTRVKSGEWSPVISKGEFIKVVGTCNGKLVDVVLSNAELIKDELP